MCITRCDFLDDSARDHERDAALERGMISTRAPPGASIKSPELNAPHTSQIQDMVNLKGERSKAMMDSAKTPPKGGPSS